MGADEMPLLQKTLGVLLQQLLTASTMFSIVFVASIGIYFQLKQLAAMRLQINVMGEMLTEEEKERYDIIRTNISNGTKLVIPERGGAGVAVDEQEKQEVPAVLKNGMAQMVIDQAFLEKIERAQSK